MHPSVAAHAERGISNARRPDCSAAISVELAMAALPAIQKHGG
jgi:hypothetical protein